MLSHASGALLRTVRCSCAPATLRAPVDTVLPSPARGWSAPLPCFASPRSMRPACSRTHYPLPSSGTPAPTPHAHAPGRPRAAPRTRIVRTSPPPFRTLTAPPRRGALLSRLHCAVLGRAQGSSAPGAATCQYSGPR